LPLLSPLLFGLTVAGRNARGNARFCAGPPIGRRKSGSIDIWQRSDGSPVSANLQREYPYSTSARCLSYIADEVYEAPATERPKRSRRTICA
jgi:hypothetical protein